MNERSPSISQAVSVAEIATPNSSKYLQQLCKHFQHKLPVTYDQHSGQIAFNIGECRLNAADGILKLTLTSPDDAQMANLQDVVARHLVRFAFREELHIDWRPAQGS
jgi:hypothetical protein